jgi:hypothetical protein
MAVLPQHMGAGHGGMAAEVHFHRRREPPQAEVAVLGNQERGLREVHFARYIPHPLFGGRFGKYANSRWVAGIRPVRERIDMNYADWHLPIRLSHFATFSGIAEYYRVRDLKVAILQIPKKCAEICAYQLRKEDSAARVRKKIAHGLR